MSPVLNIHYEGGGRYLRFFDDLNVGSIAVHSGVEGKVGILLDALKTQRGVIGRVVRAE